MNDALNALYRFEAERLLRSEYDGWSTPEEVAQALPAEHPNYNNTVWARAQLEALWTARKVMQIPVLHAEPQAIVDVQLRGKDAHGEEDGRICIEQDDVRGDDGRFATVAKYSADVQVKYRSRVAELGRLLSYNYQRFQMAPATGVLRYERRPQVRPVRNINIQALVAELRSMIDLGRITIPSPDGETTYQLAQNVNLQNLVRAMLAVFQALEEDGLQALAEFQVSSVLATLAGLYCPDYRRQNGAGYDAHVVTAGVGSGKSYAFQIGALIHCAYCLLGGETGSRVLLIYPRVVLAANQFQDLNLLVERIGRLLNIPFQLPVLDAGGQLTKRATGGDPQRGALYTELRNVYGSGTYPIIITNLDTLANRIHHPEASRGLVEKLDLIVCDEVHLLNGIYGSHARMLLKRLSLLREMWRLRRMYPERPFAELLTLRNRVSRPYFIGASATIAEPANHTARVISTEENRVWIIQSGPTEETGWVHHFFLRQKPEVSTMAALVNATACVIHNRRDGLFREYYQSPIGNNTAPQPLSQQDLPNPVIQANGPVILREPQDIHKTLGFCDSLDGVGRWGDLVADNERTKMGTTVSPNPRSDSYPYFTRFQEPLWRHVHQRSFAVTQDNWQQTLRAEYGRLCRNCKKGIRGSVNRIPTALTDAGRRRVEELWSINVNNQKFPAGSYMDRLGIGTEYANAGWLEPYRQASRSQLVCNLDECPFFQMGLCWWWSMDHVGSNDPRPPSVNTPLAGIKMLRQRNDQAHHFVNGIRVQSFTSRSAANLLELDSIDDIFQGQARKVLRENVYAQGQNENSALVIGSPRLEVGIDLSRAMDGITYRAMRDPSSLQQKVGRIGREALSDSVLVHLVTQGTRDQYYFRNPEIALDPDYLQPIPLHEDNRIIARHHFFMGIVDFLCLQGGEPGDRAIANGGERLALVNDHGNARSFFGWDQKVEGVREFLFGAHPRQVENLRNLRGFLSALGATETDIENPGAATGLTPTDAPMSRDLGAIDVFNHEFGQNFFLTPFATPNGYMVTLAQLCSSPNEIPIFELPNLPRHEDFIRTLSVGSEGQAPNAYLQRSYLFNLLTQPIFRRGIPRLNISGDHPFAWTPNFFESLGTETVRIFTEERFAQDLAYESLSVTLGLLAPGTVTYRFGDKPQKVLVSRNHANNQPTPVAPGFQAVMLAVEQPEYFQRADNCPDVTGGDLPTGFFGASLQVYTPRQLGVESSRSEPLVGLDGLLLDGDSRSVASQGAVFIQVATPPRCYSLRWFRVQSQSCAPVILRFQHRLQQYATGPTQPFPFPPLLRVFNQIQYDNQLAVTDFVWGLDRQFMSRAIIPDRLVYRGASPRGGTVPVALGHNYNTSGLIFSLATGTGSAVDSFLNEVADQPQSAAFQSLLWQTLAAFLYQFAQLPVDPGAPWLGGARPSVFTVRNLKSIILFHLLRRWHPAPNANQPPAQPPIYTIDDVVGCFQAGHVNFLDQVQFDEICGLVAQEHQAPNVRQHTQTLLATRGNFDVGCVNAARFDRAFFIRTARQILLNSLGITMHSAGLRMTGAESENLNYFYKEHDGAADIFLFDTDAFGNGTSEVIRDNIFIPSAERALTDRLRQLGNQVDPLPSKDFVRSLEEELQECASSQAAHLAYHDRNPDSECWTRLAAELRGERRRVGELFDFIRLRMNIDSFDSIIPLAECPEFLAYISANFPCYGGVSLVGSPAFPVYQALESAAAFCVSGCIGCVLSPETNIHGSLQAKETVNKLLLDAFYRRCVCETAGAPLYPADGPGRTVACADRSLVTAANLGLPAQNFTAELRLPVAGSTEEIITVISTAVTMAGAGTVTRVSWEPSPCPEPRVRVRMEF